MSEKVLHSILGVAFVGTLLFMASVSSPGRNSLSQLSRTSQTAAVSDFELSLITHVTFDDGDIDGKIGKAKVFDGDDTVSIPASSLQSLSGANGATMAFWIKKNTASNGGFVSRWGLCRQFDFRFFDNDTFRNTWRLGGDCGTGTSFTHSGSSADITTDSWQHVALVYSNPHSYIYVDGVLKSQATGNGGVLNKGSTDPLIIGQGSSGTFFAGALDDFRVYSSALTASQINELYALGGGVANTNQTTNTNTNTNTNTTPTQTTPTSSDNVTPTTGSITYYVSASGSDTNNGSQNSPFKTIQRCADVARAGNTCLVTSGTYPEHVVTKAGGTSSNQTACIPVEGTYPNFSSNDGECSAQRITFKAQENVTMRGFDIKHPFISVEGFNITGYQGGYSGHIQTYPAGQYCRIVNNVIRDGLGDTNGIRLNSNYCVVKGNVLRNLLWHFLWVDDANGGGQRNLFEANVFEYQNSMDYIRLFGKDNYFRKNVFRLGYRKEGVNNHPDFVQTFGNNGGQSKNMLFEYNWIDGMESQFSQLTHDGHPNDFGDWTFRQNLFANISNNSNVGISGIKFLNNSFYRMSHVQNGIGGGGSPSYSDNSRMSLVNNAFISGGVGPETGLRGYYSNSGGALSRNQDLKSLPADDARAVMDNLVLNGYTNNNGRPTDKARALTSINDFTFVPPSSTTKQKIYDLLRAVAALDNSIKSTFVADYNFVTGQQSENWPAKRYFVEPHGVNGGNPMVRNPLDLDGPDNIPFTLDDGLKPLPGSPLCGKGSGGVDIGVYSCDPNKVFSISEGGAIVVPSTPTIPPPIINEEGVIDVEPQTPSVPINQTSNQSGGNAPASSGGGGGGGGGGTVSSPVVTPGRGTATTGASGGSSGPRGSQALPSIPVPPNSMGGVLIKLLTAPRTFGSTHDEIKKLQVFLNTNGFTIAASGPGSKGLETAYFGPGTLKALNRFQIAKGLTSRTLDITTVNLINSLTTATTTASTITPSILPNNSVFSRTLSLGMSGPDVLALQQFLNNKGFTITASGPGSKGLETAYFGNATKAALIKFQETYRSEILTPNGLTKGTGAMGPSTIKKINSLR